MEILLVLPLALTLSCFVVYLVVVTVEWLLRLINFLRRKCNELDLV